MRVRTHPFVLLMPALALLPLVPVQRTAAQTIAYDNTTTITGGDVFNGSIKNGSDTLTNMDAAVAESLKKPFSDDHTHDVAK